MDFGALKGGENVVIIKMNSSLIAYPMRGNYKNNSERLRYITLVEDFETLEK